MFDKILIANRGEIACRIIRSARALGVRTVAVFSDADAGALHVEMADEAVHIGGPRPAESYLRGDLIIRAALERGAQAIHPGYGFLSENPEFAQAVEDAGLTFIGPSAEAIRAMGLKDAAKARMQAAGVPVVPGYHGENQDPEHLSGAADAIGYPVLIKAVAGGGGKGMRLVTRPEDFAQALASARAEAEAAFGNPDVLIEKFITTPRHIEVQIFGDGTRAVHLYERDCSLQRRHQKVIEEAPAPGMTDETRRAMGEAAVRAAQAIGYRGAGTVEFIVDASGGLRPDRFWFMEMNTRLQVEHPVTEEVVGIDLVEWQLRVAAGEGLPRAQDEIALSGHAVEARLYAEDVPAGFLPATGRLAHLAFGPGARIETGVRAGDEISPWYDPMIAKVITHGPTRDIALARLLRALETTEVAGTTTNLGFLARLAAQPDFVAGRLDTGLIERELAALATAPEPGPPAVAAAALAATGLDDPAPDGFSLWQPMRHEVRLVASGEPVPCAVAALGQGRREVAFAGEVIEVTHAAGRWASDGRPLPRALRHGGIVTVFAQGGIGFEIEDPLTRSAAVGLGAGLIEAPMPGLVKALNVAPGERVEEGQVLAFLEAMKMEHPLAAPGAGVVAEVLTHEGAQVEAGAPLVRLEPEGEEEERAP